MMIKPRTMLLAAAAATALTGSAAAMPLNNISPDQGLLHDARLVCNQRGHCYETRRHVYRGYRYLPGGRYAYGGGPYGYEYGYRSAPSYFYDDYGPGIGFNFGFGDWRR